MKRQIAVIAAIIHTTLLPIIAGGQNIRPANPNASEEARKVLDCLHNLPKRSENRLISGHLAGGSVGPTAPKGHDTFTKSPGSGQV